MRTLGDDTAAAKLLSASMTTSYTPQAENAQSHPDVKLRTTSRAMIATRTDFWDPLTEDDPEIERARDDKSRREGYLERANALLDRKIGMTEVKDHLHSLANLAKVNEEMERRGLTTAPQNWNQQFLGPPGTGKSTIVKAYTLFLAAYGIVDDPEPKIVSAEDLTDGTVGGTAPKTKEVVAGAKGKVLFIDEFYALLPDETNRTGANSAGVEAINTLVNLMEPLIGTTVFVFAGYPWEMARVINVNPGMPRRVPNVVNFASFTLDQFSKVTAIEAETAGLVIADDAMDWLADEHGPMRMVHERPAGVGDTVMDNLGNGGFARNLVQKANLRRASRLAASDMSVLDQDAMRTLTLDDIAPVAEKEIHDAMHGTAASR
jgi:SpoVK/Ycf46/Vps4 family AAA+-type ATPase